VHAWPSTRFRSLNAIQRQSSAVDRAAEKIARATAVNASDAPTTSREAEALASQEAGLLDGLWT
jgi:hypothetical protein